MSDPVLELNNLTFAYPGGDTVLRDCHLTLRAGERVGLIGSNGVGKTTLLESVVGLIHPSEGERRLFGRPCREEADFVTVRRRAGLLFGEADDQLFHLTVADDVAFGPFNLGWDRARVIDAVRETLEQLGLGGYEERITYRLSRGEKRLVSIATILVMQPELLLLDEPTAGLDEEHVERLIAILTSLPSAQLIVSHDVSFLESVTHRICALTNGRLQDRG